VGVVIKVEASWRDYVHVTKPRIVLSNLIAAFAGFWLASRWEIDWGLMVVTLAGSALVMGSACAFNNVVDREMDVKMERTSRRPLAVGRLKPRSVIIYAAILFLIGEALLFAANALTALFGFIGFFVYVVVYTIWLKRTSTWSTSVGGISGAMPPVIGYVAVTNEADIGAWLLFAILFLWQPPHFWALGIRRVEEYRAAGFPLLPVVKGVRRTKIQMVPYVALLIAATTLMYVYDYVGIFYLIVTGAMGLIWLAYCLAGFVAKDDASWARKTFLFSVNYLTVINIMLVLNTAS
jgi:protoheme IX farnesyltransferase